MDGRVKVYTGNQVYLAEMIKGRLESEGISALVLNQQDSSYQTFGYVEVYVLTEDEERAKEIIAESENE